MPNPSFLGTALPLIQAPMAGVQGHALAAAVCNAGGLGSGMAHTPEDLARIAGDGLAASPVHEVLIEESVLGWKEYELEVMRDKKDNVVIIC